MLGLEAQVLLHHRRVAVVVGEKGFGCRHALGVVSGD
jgi:hypothetical protein